jgi:hypothetical protein
MSIRFRTATTRFGSDGGPCAIPRPRHGRSCGHLSTKICLAAGLCDRLKERFVLYVGRKLLTLEAIAQIQSAFSLSPDKTNVETDFHYQSHERP